MSSVIPDASARHWVYKMPQRWQPYLQLSRLDRPVGYWLLALPGWIGLAFAGLRVGLATSDLKWALLILIGAIAMRGAGCTYNDIVDQDLDAKVERTAARPLPAGTVTTRQAWIWLLAQVAIGFAVWLCLPWLAKSIALGALPLVAAYPFMKRITWWPQLWLGLTFNWAVLVAFAAKTGTVSPALFILYAGLIFWTVGYDTIYACQDIEDDAFVGIKSTARRFGGKLVLGVAACYLLAATLVSVAYALALYRVDFGALPFTWAIFAFLIAGFVWHLWWQVRTLSKKGVKRALSIFKSNVWTAAFLIMGLILAAYTLHGNLFDDLGGVFA